MSFQALGLKPELLRAIEERGYTIPTPVQVKAIPEVLAGRDLLAGAQTGTGKTAGFTLPILQLLTAPGAVQLRTPRVLVLVPTRELAAQVAESVKTYGKYLPISTTVVFGGVGFNPQAESLRRGTDIVVATPGRLLDHVQQRTIDLSKIQILVLDEADRMLDMGFIRDIRRILKLLPPKRQNMMFSATYSDDIRELAGGLLHNPVSIEVARRNAPIELVIQHVHEIRKEDKRRLLSHLIRNSDWGQVLVFTRTKHGANRLTKQLEDDGINASAIHGNKSQAARTKALGDFKAGRITALVATEVAARGLDINQLACVVNYELPNVPEDYVHRIGRTGRAGATGVAISLVAGEERGLLKDIERLLGRPILKAQLPAISEPPVRPNRPAVTEERYVDPRAVAQRQEANRSGGNRGSGGPRNGNSNGHNQRRGGGGGRPGGFSSNRSSGR
ncbi:MAG: DEAD/DEAH box helicase [Gammaproteobacteria bacterium]|nr:DEAD/DEAH box helicase [Gammaproteobacteria bacterium]